MRLRRIGLIILLSFSATVIYAQNTGDIDLTFNQTDIGFGIGQGPNLQISSTVIQSDGKIVITGFFTSIDGIPIDRIARLNTDGSFDASFDPGTGPNGMINKVILQPDDRIIIIGTFTSYNGTPRNQIARLNSNGTLDVTFDPGVGANSSVEGVAIQGDGKIIISGFFNTYNGIPRQMIARLNSDGSLDNGFDPGTGVTTGSFIASIGIQSDGKIIVAGSFILYDFVSRNNIARLNPDGSHDLSFDPGTGASARIFSIRVQSDDKVIIAGEFISFNGTARNAIARLNSDGSLDAGFDPGLGPTWYFTISGFGMIQPVIQPDGKIIVAGAFLEFNGTPRNQLARLNTDGSLDPGFDVGDLNNIGSVAIQPDGKIIIAGPLTFINNTLVKRIARVNTDGTLDPSFLTEMTSMGGAEEHVEAIAVQPDGKIIISGGFVSYNGVIRKRIARLNADGTLDAAFDVGTGANGNVIRFAIQPDGKIVIGGFFFLFNGLAINNILRLNSNGSIDSGFDTGTGTDSFIRPVIYQPDGKIIIGGNFTLYNGTPRNRIARLNSNGSIDDTFDPGSGVNGLIESIALQSDGKIIIGGGFSLVNGIARNRVARLNTDGSLDMTFNPGTGASGNVRSLAIQPNGKIIVTGDFTSFNGTSINRIVRLNADGSLDTGFNPGGGANSTVRSPLVQPSGRILIGGSFTLFDGVARNRIARLNPDGSLDMGFDPGSGSDNIIFSLAFQSNSDLIIGGSFLSYNGVGRNRVARISLVNKSLNADSLALVAFYNATAGANWTNKAGWLVGPISTWNGITLTGGRVTAISLPDNKISGDLPPEFANLIKLNSFNLSGNNISSVPDITGLPDLVSANLSGNNLNFASLELNASVPGINYGDQAELGEFTETLVDVGANYTVSVEGGGLSDQYQWKREGENIAGANQKTYTIVSINRSNMGDYECMITNPFVPGLTLTTEIQRVLATATLSGRLLINPTTAASAGEMTLFRIRLGAYDTTAVKTINPDGTYAIEKVVLDDYQLLGFADTLTHVDALPTYFEKTVYWEEADTLRIENNIASLDIISQFKPAPPKNGVGEISGIFSEEVGDEGGRTLRNQRIKNAGASLRRVERTGRGNEVILTLIAYTFTNEVGEFLFNKLDPGEYLLNLQYPGYPMDPESFINIIIGTGLLDKQVGVEAQVIDGKIVVRKRIITGWLETDSPYGVYPNPANDWIYVKNKTGSSRGLSINARDYNGRTIEIPVKYESQNDTWSIDVKNLPFGSYLLRVGEGKNYKVLKVMVVN